jgi:hypothetical protein
VLSPDYIITFGLKPSAREKERYETIWLGSSDSFDVSWSGVSEWAFFFTGVAAFEARHH